jgi:hypothetical protein
MNELINTYAYTYVGVQIYVYIYTFIFIYKQYIYYMFAYVPPIASFIGVDTRVTNRSPISPIGVKIGENLC